MPSRCKCGCGAFPKLAGSKVLQGHHMRSASHKRRAGISASRTLKKLWKSPTFRQMQLDAQTTPKTVLKKSKAMKAVWKRKGYKAKLSMAVRKGVLARYRKQPEIKELLRAIAKQQWHNPKYRTKQAKTRSAKKYLRWAVQHGMDSIRRARPKPNNSEHKMDSLLRAHFPKKFKLNVKGLITVGGKIPDFVSAKGRKIIEVFGIRWHTTLPGFTRREAEHHRKAILAKHGFATLIVWSDILDRSPQYVISRVRKFLAA